MDAGTLADAINDAGCPTVSVVVGDGNDRATWAFTVPPGTPQTQIDAGNNVVATIPIEPKGKIASEEFIARFTNAEYLALEKKRRDDIAANKVGNAKNWDILVTATSIDFNRQKAETVKADLVTDGVLTQARADEIFS